VRICHTRKVWDDMQQQAQRELSQQQQLGLQQPVKQAGGSGH